jgi:hypothetical protein
VILRGFWHGTTRGGLNGSGASHVIGSGNLFGFLVSVRLEAEDKIREAISH